MSSLWKALFLSNGWSPRLLLRKDALHLLSREPSQTEQGCSTCVPLRWCTPEGDWHWEEKMIKTNLVFCFMRGDGNFDGRRYCLRMAVVLRLQLFLSSSICYIYQQEVHFYRYVTLMFSRVSLDEHQKKCHKTMEAVRVIDINSTYFAPPVRTNMLKNIQWLSTSSFENIVRCVAFLLTESSVSCFYQNKAQTKYVPLIV